MLEKSEGDARMERRGDDTAPATGRGTDAEVPDTPLQADERGERTPGAQEDSVDQAIEMTFPASDPPAWMSSGTRRPGGRTTDRSEDRA